MVMGRNSSIEARANTREVMGVISPVFIVFASGTLLCVLCVSVVIGMYDTTTTETQRTQRLHREIQTGHYPDWRVVARVTECLLVFKVSVRANYLNRGCSNE